MKIRPETPQDFDAIERITIAAFEHHPHSCHNEQHIIRALREAGALAISLVAEKDAQVAGHVAFSAVQLPRAGNWYGLGPVAVHPPLQRQGIGTALIEEGLKRLKTLGASGCVLVGEPQYYTRFGFKGFPELSHEGVPQQYVLALPFGAEPPQGSVRFHAAFHQAA